MKIFQMNLGKNSSKHLKSWFLDKIAFTKTGNRAINSKINNVFKPFEYKK